MLASVQDDEIFYDRLQYVWDQTSTWHQQVGVVNLIILFHPYQIYHVNNQYIIIVKPSCKKKKFIKCWTIDRSFVISIRSSVLLKVNNYNSVESVHNFYVIFREDLTISSVTLSTAGHYIFLCGLQKCTKRIWYLKCTPGFINRRR